MKVQFRKTFITCCLLFTTTEKIRNFSIIYSSFLLIIYTYPRLIISDKYTYPRLSDGANTHLSAIISKKKAFFNFF